MLFTIYKTDIMKLKNFFFLLLFLFGSLSILKAQNFDKSFIDKTMRFDFYHLGNSTEEHISFDQIVSDGIWGGSKTKLRDELRLGKYLFEIVDPESNTIIYSRGYSAIYGEWETTLEAKEKWGVFHESLRFPWPLKKVKLVLNKRNEKNEFDAFWDFEIDPEADYVNPVDLNPLFNIYTALENGDPVNKLDIVVLPEGYAKEDAEKLRKDVDHLVESLFNYEPFKSRKTDFNIRAIEIIAPNSGCNHPQQDIYKRSATSVSYGAFGSQRYALGYDNKKIRDLASAVPYEYTIILMNDSIYGGGGIYNLYITAACDNAFTEYLFVHEFGHHFADLADEYYTSATAYEMGSTIIEPWELNVTSQTEKAKIKWFDMIEEDTPVPTPWEKEKVDNHSMEIQKKRAEMRASKVNEADMEKLFRDQQEWEENVLNNMKYSGKVGAFEGAMYHQYGIYRSYHNCIMYTRTDFFCPACMRAINMVINQSME